MSTATQQSRVAAAERGARVACHWVGGEWLLSGRRADSFDPASGRVIGSFYDGGGVEAQVGIDAALEAFQAGDWRSDAFLRSTALAHLADAYEARSGDLIETLCAENGKVQAEAGLEASFVPRALRFAAGLALHNFGRVVDSKPGQQSMVIRQPAGVAGLIVPWNSPAYLFIRALAPALAAGCTVVAKLPAQAAQSAALASEIIQSVPELGGGIVNVFVESGSEGAQLLVSSPDVPVVSYTGSTKTGRLIAAAAAPRLKRLSLELGGKTPHIVFEDANLDVLLPTLEKSSTVFAGQFCMTGSRVLVQRPIAERVIDGLAQRLRAVKAGPASDSASDMGPLINKAAVQRVDQAVKDAIAGGAEVIVRGGPATEPDLAGGAFYNPTLLRVADQSLPIVQTETFGPVQTVQVFNTEQEGIALANDSEYGLSACVWSQDVNRPIRVARTLEAGLISINSWANLAVEFEEGGWKASGAGRLGGLASLDDFTEYKQITQNYA